MIPFAPQALILAVAVAGAFFSGYNVASDKCAAKAAKAEAAAQIEFLKKTEELYAISTQYEELRARRTETARVITRTVTQIVANPMYQRECFDDAGVRAANDALKGSIDPGESSSTVRPIATP